nr:MAG TPA: hypothetical protein [Caudoviricetes sp.]
MLLFKSVKISKILLEPYKKALDNVKLIQRASNRPSFYKFSYFLNLCLITQAKKPNSK